MSRPVVVGLLLSLGAILGTTLIFIAPETDEQQTIEWLENPRSLRNFSLETETGEFNNQSLKGQWTIVSFGFLHCPDICPTSLSQLGTLAKNLAEMSLEQEVSFVFVSVDPGRDSLAEISRYVRHFHSSIFGATGKEEQLTKLTSDLGVQFMASPDTDDYAVSHSITISIIDPKGIFRGRFRPGFDAANLVKNLTLKLEEASI